MLPFAKEMDGNDFGAIMEKKSIKGYRNAVNLLGNCVLFN